MQIELKTLLKAISDLHQSSCNCDNKIVCQPSTSVFQLFKHPICLCSSGTVALSLGLLLLSSNAF